MGGLRQHDRTQPGRDKEDDCRNVEAFTPAPLSGHVDCREISPLVEIAVEMRQRVTDQLAKILPTEFSGVQYGFKLMR